jgi:pyruvate ferredoxin oxidoreductase alpha subunit
LHTFPGSRKKRPFVHNYILGLGGREIKTSDLYEAFKDSCLNGDKADVGLKWIGLKI